MDAIARAERIAIWIFPAAKETREVGAFGMHVEHYREAVFVEWSAILDSQSMDNESSGARLA